VQNVASIFHLRGSKFRTEQHIKNVKHIFKAPMIVICPVEISYSSVPCNSKDPSGHIIRPSNIPPSVKVCQRLGPREKVYSHARYNNTAVRTVSNNIKWRVAREAQGQS